MITVTEQDMKVGDFIVYEINLTADICTRNKFTPEETTKLINALNSYVDEFINRYPRIYQSYDIESLIDNEDYNIINLLE